VASVVSSVVVLVIGWQVSGQATTGQSLAGGTDAAAGSATTAGGTAVPSTGDDSASTDSGTGSDSSTGTSDSGTTGSGTTDSGTDSSGSTSDSGTSSSGSSGSAADGTYTGDVASTRYGDAQVSITVSGGQITDVTAIELPDDDRHSQQISWSAEPILRQEVLAAQSADISVVSRATTTSHGYLESLQSAFEKAGL
jgi:uncharacterized protein with FMN-binding domain